MSCPNATAPVDIDQEHVLGKCELKCAYRYQYNGSSCVVTHRGDYLSLSYDASVSPPVVYNAVGYDVKDIRLYTPSLHSYHKLKTDAELIIIHSSSTGANPLLVCIPIRANSLSSSLSSLSSGSASSIMSTIIDSTAKLAPTQGETATLQVPTYNANAFLTTGKPFYSYTATEPFQPCASIVDYIVFDVIDAAIDISSSTLSVLQQVIQKNAYTIAANNNKSTKLFYNEKGANKGLTNGNDDIYIDCQPVGESDESIDIIQDSTTSSSSSNSNKKWYQYLGVQLILATVSFLLLLLGIKFGFSFFQEKTQKGKQMTKIISPLLPDDGFLY